MENVLKMRVRKVYMEKPKLVEWKEEFDTGFHVIDEQHKKIIDIMNRLNTSIHENRHDDSLFDELIAYADTHFTTEEGLFDQFGYQDAKVHKIEHASFRRKILELRDDWEHNKVEVSFKLVDFLEKWFIGHVTGEDRKYIPLFKEHHVE